MNQRELLILSVGIFLTIVAWMIIDLYHVKTNNSFDTALRPVTIPHYSINSKVFNSLNEMSE
ncbi:MAG: hypothetical protein RI947_377 [Candidatus Parcubacteria bacterium]|jgi:hypothetical protein